MLKTLKLFFLLIFIPFLLLAVIWFSRSAWLQSGLNHFLSPYAIQLQSLHLLSPLHLKSADIQLDNQGHIRLEGLEYRPDADQLWLDTLHLTLVSPVAPEDKAVLSSSETQPDTSALPALIAALPDQARQLYRQLEMLRVQTGLNHVLIQNIHLNMQPSALLVSSEAPETQTSRAQIIQSEPSNTTTDISMPDIFPARLAAEMIYQQEQWIINLISQQPLVSESQLILADNNRLFIRIPLDSNRDTLQHWLAPLIAVSDTTGSDTSNDNPRTIEVTDEADETDGRDGDGDRQKKKGRIENTEEEQSTRQALLPTAYQLSQTQLTQLFEPGYWKDKEITLEANLFRQSGRDQLTGELEILLPDAPLQTNHCRLTIHQPARFGFNISLTRAELELLPQSLPELHADGACLNPLAGLDTPSRIREKRNSSSALSPMPMSFEITPGKSTLKLESGRWWLNPVHNTVTGDSLTLHGEHHPQNNPEGGSGALQLEPVTLDIRASQLNMVPVPLSDKTGDDSQNKDSTTIQNKDSTTIQNKDSTTVTASLPWSFTSQVDLSIDAQAQLNSPTSDHWLLAQLTSGEHSSPITADPPHPSWVYLLNQWLHPGQAIPFRARGGGKVRFDSQQGLLSYQNDLSPWVIEMGRAQLKDQLTLASTRLTLAPSIRWHTRTGHGQLKLDSTAQLSLNHPMLKGNQIINLNQQSSVSIPQTGSLRWKTSGDGNLGPVAMDIQLSGSPAQPQPMSGKLSSSRSLLLGDLSQWIRLPDPLVLNTGELTWSADIAAPDNIQARIRINELGGQYQGYQVSGFNTELPVHLNNDTLLLLPGQLYAEQAFTGVELQQLSARIEGQIKLQAQETTSEKPTGKTSNQDLGNTDPLEGLRLRLWQGQAHLFQGQLAIDQLNYPFTGQPSLIRLREIDIQQLINLADSQQIQVTGQLSGEIPVHLYQDGAEVHQGQVSTTGTGELILKRNPAWQAMLEQNQTLGASLRHLNHLHYDQLKGQLDMDKTGNLLIQLQIAGENRAEKQPVNLNFNVEQNILTLLKALRLSEEISQTLDKSVQRKY